MKVCQRCLNAISSVAPLSNTWIVNEDGGPKPKATERYIVDLVQESECSFWVHQAFNKTIVALGWRQATYEEQIMILKDLEEWRDRKNANH